MSRRILPRRGCDPVQIVHPFGFTATQRQQILDTLPCVRGEESEFIAGLERCAGKFLWLRNQYHARWTQAEQNAALTEIGRLAGELKRQLCCPDIEVEWALWLSAALSDGYLPDLCDRLEIVADGAARTLELGEKNRSAPQPCDRPDNARPQAPLRAIHGQSLFAQSEAKNPVPWPASIGRRPLRRGLFPSCRSINYANSDLHGYGPCSTRETLRAKLNGSLPIYGLNHLSMFSWQRAHPVIARSHHWTYPGVNTLGRNDELRFGGSIDARKK